MLRGGWAVRLAAAVGMGLSLAAPAAAQTASSPTVAGLTEQVLGLFPETTADVADVQGDVLTVSLSRRDGARPGLLLHVFREGREIRHPRTGQVLGRTERALGQAVIFQAQEAFALARVQGAPGEAIQVGDRVRTPPGRVPLMLLTLAGAGVKAGLVESVAQELYEGLTRSGRFTVVLGEPAALWLAQQGLEPAQVVQGRGVPEVAERFKADPLLVVHVHAVQRRPFMEVRLFSGRPPEPVLTTALHVPPSIRAGAAGQFSASDRLQPGTPERRRSLLERLLGWGADPAAYSAADPPVPLREIARFPFAAVSLDVAVAPADGQPRLAISDGEKVYVYRIAARALEPEWTYYARSLGRVISVQLADLDGDGVLEVVVNRFDTRIGMSSMVLGVRDGRAIALADQVDAILLAVDEEAAGVRRTLWGQRYREESFFTRGQADLMVLRDGRLAVQRSVPVPESFRATGATFSTITGKDVRTLAYIDEQNRLRITSGTEEVWRSSSPVGGGLPKLEVFRQSVERGGRSYYYRLEPIPLAVDLDGDGIQEIVVPQNEAETGMLAVVFRTPAGLRFQPVRSGFEGVIVGLGTVPAEDGEPPSLVAGVVRYRTLLRGSGETQVIMAGQE